MSFSNVWVSKFHCAKCKTTEVQWDQTFICNNYLTHLPDTMDINIPDEQTTPSNNILERPTMWAYDAISFQVFSSYLFVRQYIKPSLPISVLPISWAAYHRNSECPFPTEAYNVCLHELPQEQYIQLCVFMRKFILVFDLFNGFWAF